MVGLRRGIFKRRENIVFFERGIIRDYFLMGCARAQQTQNVRDANAQAAYARTPAAFAGFDGDPIEQACFHAVSREVRSIDEYDVDAFNWQGMVLRALVSARASMKTVRRAHHTVLRPPQEFIAQLNRKIPRGSHGRLKYGC
jgi:hypothetical protein